MPITVLTLLQVVTRSHQRMALLEEQLNAADALLGDGDTGSMPARVFEPKNGNGYRFPQAFRRTLHESWSANGLRLAAQQALRLRR